MAMLKLAAVGGLRLTIPSGSVRTVEGLQPGRFQDAPEAGAAIRYLIGNQLRTRVVMESRDELLGMPQADRAAREVWLSVEMANGQCFDFQARDVSALEDLDPELPASKGCNLLVDLLIEGIPVTDLYANGDGDEIRAAVWPDVDPADLTAPTRKAGRKTAQPTH